MQDPFKITEPTLISFSGGRTSAYMLWRVLQSNGGIPDDAAVCFANTGKEDEATLKFVQNCSDHWGCHINWLEYRVGKPGYETVTFESASRNGEPFDLLITKKNYLPNTFARFCTQELKVNLFKKAFPNHQLTFVGIRADEPRRVAKMANNKDEKYCPLAVSGVTQQDVMEFWKSQPFDLELETMNGNALLGNCDLCFLKKLNHKNLLIRQYPDKANWWVAKEKQINAVFRQDHPSYQQMVKNLDKQKEMFEDESIPCFCGD
jgi:3'-phosphoadenosine 5'-phosphosulfate sulfotransferase (PAPS reductase)/FAD synthetase